MRLLVYGDGERDLEAMVGCSYLLEVLDEPLLFVESCFCILRPSLGHRSNIRYPTNPGRREEAGLSDLLAASSLVRVTRLQSLTLLEKPFPWRDSRRMPRVRCSHPVTSPVEAQIPELFVGVARP